MVVKKGDRVLNSYVLVNVHKNDGCPTKFSRSQFVNKNPSQAAKKALTELCNTKRIRGQCSFYVTIQNTTNGHINKGKKYMYKCSRVKLDKPIVLANGVEFNYASVCKSVKSIPKSTSKCIKSSGRRFKSRPYTPSGTSYVPKSKRSKSRSKSRKSKPDNELMSLLKSETKQKGGSSCKKRTRRSRK